MVMLEKEVMVRMDKKEVMAEMVKRVLAIVMDVAVAKEATVAKEAKELQVKPVWTARPTLSW